MPTPPSKAPRRWLWWGTGSLAAAALAVLAGEASGWPFLQQPLQNAIARAAGVPVTLSGPFSTRLLWQPRLHIGQLHVAPGGGVNVPHLLDAQQVQLAWRWADLWRWRQGEVLRVHALQAETLSVHLVRQADGHASWQLGPPRAQPAGAQTAALEGLPRFGLLRAGMARIEVDDAPSRTRLLAELQGGEGEVQPDGTKPGYRGTVEGQWQALPLALALRSGSALPLLHDADAATPPGTLRVEGRAGAAQVLFDGTASALLGERALQGRLRISGPSLAQVGAPLKLTLPHTPPFDVQGRIAHGQGVWQLQAERATIGRSQLDGDFRFDTRATPPRLSGRLGGTRLALADLGPAVGAPAAGAASAPAAAASAAGKVLPQRRFDLPSLRAMDADVQVAIAELDFGSPALAPFKDVQSQLLLQGGVLQLQGLQAVVAGGRFSGSTRLDANQDAARWATDLSFTGIDAAGWVRALNAGPEPTAPRSAAALKVRREEARRGGSPPVRAYLTGTLTGRLQATGQGRSAAEILGSLNGQAQLRLNDGTLSHLVTELAGLDLAQALGVLIRNDEPLLLRCAVLTLGLQQGVVRLRQAVLDNADSTLRLAGQVDLRDETLALQAQVKPKDFSPLALRVPIVVSGTLGAPVVGVDGQRLAGKALGMLALAVVVAPTAALLPLVDTASSDAADPCAPAPASAKAAAPGKTAASARQP